MTDVISEADRDAFAREAVAAIEAVLDRRCPETKTAFWTAVDMLYRLDSQPRAVPRPNPDGQPPAQSR
jgi:hypothetical protein